MTHHNDIYKQSTLTSITYHNEVYRHRHLHFLFKPIVDTFLDKHQTYYTDSSCDQLRPVNSCYVSKQVDVRLQQNIYQLLKQKCRNSSEQTRVNRLLFNDLIQKMQTSIIPIKCFAQSAEELILLAHTTNGMQLDCQSLKKPKSTGSTGKAICRFCQQIKQ